LDPFMDAEDVVISASTFSSGLMNAILASLL